PSGPCSFFSVSHLSVWSPSLIGGAISATAALSFDPQQLSRILVQNLPRHFLTRRQSLNRRKLLRPAAFFAGPERITAIAAVEQFALMARDEFAGVVFVAQHRVQSRTGGQVGVHVRVIRE